jgi:hypothetical protein
VKEGGEKKGSARGSSVQGATTPQPSIEVDPQHLDFGLRESDFARQGLVECRALET